MGEGDKPRIEPLFEAIVAHSTDSIMVLDLDARIRFINRTAPGLTPDEVVGRSVYDFVSEDQHEQMRRCFADVIATGRADRYESVYPVSPDVVTRWESRVGPIKSGEAITGLVVFASDVTARTTASEERDRVFELSADLMCVARFDGYFTRVNPAFVRTLGYTERELLATPFIALVHPDDRAATTAAFERQVEDCVAIHSFENRYLCKDGSVRLLQWTSKPDAVSRRVFAVARDVTDQRALEEQLRHSQKMDAVGQLAGGVAHDFNNLIQAILGNAEFALAGSRDPEIKTYLHDVLAASQRASTLTRQLLTFGRRSALDVTRVDLDAMVRELVQLVRRVIPEHIKIEVPPARESAAVDGDRGQLEQVVMNLCLNARDAMPSGGRLTIATHNTVVDDAFAEAHPWAKPGRYVVLTVTDTGSGIAPELRDRIFEPFFTTKAPGEGSGLGLAVAYGIAQQHDGMLRVESEPGRGATFTLHLPASRQAAAVAPVEYASQSPRGGTETILLAEDEPLVRSLLVRVLQRAGYRVLAAANGTEAIELCRANPSIDLAMLDVIMPDLSGPEVHRYLEELRPGLPTLFVSGYSDATRFTHRIPEGAIVLAKPFEVEDVLTRVRELLDGVGGAART